MNETRTGFKTLESAMKYADTGWPEKNTVSEM
jgi:hypothetical protein